MKRVAFVLGNVKILSGRLIICWPVTAQFSRWKQPFAQGFTKLTILLAKDGTGIVPILPAVKGDGAILMTSNVLRSAAEASELSSLESGINVGAIGLSKIRDGDNLQVQADPIDVAKLSDVELA